MFSSIGRTGVVATVVAVALTALQPSMAFAGSATSGKAVTASTGTSDATDISARRRYYRGGGGAAAAAAFAGIVGTGIAIAATQNRRDYYDNGYGYYGGPAYYHRPAPYYYGPRTYYGGGPYYGGW
jgi:lysozyme family protein